jgi:phage tail sheath protein FI
VYIQEVQSSVHTIVGVPTSVAAFVGYAARGPVADTPVQVNSWADFVRAFGGFDPSSQVKDAAFPMNYAVFLFFMNGGNSAQIVRAAMPGEGGSGAAARIALPPESGPAEIGLVATSPGTWGNNLQVVVDTKNLKNPATQFNLTITETGIGGVSVASESYTGLSVGAGGLGASTGGIGITTALASSALMNVDTANSNLTTGTKPPAVGTYFPEPPPKAKPAAEGESAGEGQSDAGAKPAPPASSLGVDVPVPTAASPLDVVPVDGTTGIYALVKADIFNMLCLPTTWKQTYPPATLGDVATFCAQKRAMLIVDPPTAWSQATPPLTFETVNGTAALGGPDTANAATYYPNLLVSDPVTGATVQLGPCGAVAGVWASTDDARGVWKAPAGTAAAIAGISDLAVHIDDGESGVLNPIAVNCLRTLPLAGPVSWGARTAAGADEDASQWKYISVRRTALFVEESIRRGTQWAVFEPNDEPLWSSIRLNIGAFMNSLFTQGAFQGSTPGEAYLVQCDADNNPQNSIDLGILNILVGFQPLMPAEFVIIQIEQLVGQLQG